MLIENNSLELKYLTEQGFTIDCFDGNSGFWLTKNYKSKLLQNVNIYIEDFNGEAIIRIDVKNEFEDGLFTIAVNKYSRKRLKKLINVLRLK